MSIKKRTTNLRTFPSIRRRKSRIADLEFQLRLTHSALMILGMQPTPTSILTQRQQRSLKSITRRTGLNEEFVMRRAMGNWLEIEAPVYRQYYDA